MKGIVSKIVLGLMALAPISGGLWAQAPSRDGWARPGLVAPESGVSMVGGSGTRAGFVVDFGPRLVGSLVRAQLQYENVGAGPITDIEISPITGLGAEAYAIFDEACTGETLAPGAGCIITVDFSPPDADQYTAQFDVISTSVNSPETLTLLGQGIIDGVFSDRFEPPD